MADPINLSVTDRIATVSLNRPPVNAFDAGMFRAFNNILDGLERRSDWSVLHLRSALKGILGRRRPRRDQRPLRQGR
jgi:enoyl-CoA hydratase/carnithine racemase